MNKKYQSKLEDIENETDSLKKKKRGRPVGSKKVYSLIDMENRYWEGHSAGMNDCESCHADIEVPTLRRIPSTYDCQKDFDHGTVCGYESASSDFKKVNKITWVLTAVNVAILGYLIIKNM